MQVTDTPSCLELEEGVDVTNVICYVVNDNELHNP